MTGLVKSGLLHSPVDKMRVPFPLMDSAAPIRFSILIVLRAVLTDTPNRSAIFHKTAGTPYCGIPPYTSHEADGRTGHSKPADGRYKSARQTKSVPGPVSS